LYGLNLARQTTGWHDARMTAKAAIIPQGHTVKHGHWHGLTRAIARATAHATEQAIRRLPSDCPLCGLPAHGGDLCTACADDVRDSVFDAPGRCACCSLALPRAEMVCPDCTSQPPAFARAMAVFDYTPPLDTLIHALKTGLKLNVAGLLGRLLAQSLAQALRQTPNLPQISAPVPIPASRASLRQRGFNPAVEIARTVSAQLHIPVQTNWLMRTRESGKQSQLGRRARQRGAEGLYRCPQQLPPVWVAVVDDVMTTGSTMNAAARALCAAGAAGVIALAAARTPYAAVD